MNNNINTQSEEEILPVEKEKTIEEQLKDLTTLDKQSWKSLLCAIPKSILLIISKCLKSVKIWLFGVFVYLYLFKDFPSLYLLIFALIVVFGREVLKYIKFP